MTRAVWIIKGLTKRKEKIAEKKTDDEEEDEKKKKSAIVCCWEPTSDDEIYEKYTRRIKKTPDAIRPPLSLSYT